MINSKKNEEVIGSMLSTISDISKKTQHFGQLRQLLPVVAEMRKAQICNKQMNDLLKLLAQSMPKLRNKVLPNVKNGESIGVFDRMTNHINSQFAKMKEQFEDLQSKCTISMTQRDQFLKGQTHQLIKDIEQILNANKKKIFSLVESKKNEYLSKENVQSYLRQKINLLIKKESKIQSNLLQCKYNFGQYLCLSSVYVFWLFRKNKQLPENNTQLINNYNNGQHKDKIIDRLDQKAQLEKRTTFLARAEENINKEYDFVVSNLLKFSKIKQSTKYEQKLFHNYYLWGKRLKVSLQTLIIQISVYQRTRISHPSQKKFLQNCKMLSATCEYKLKELMKFID